jgi:miniconductance mechanosensitive channel
MFGYLSKIFTKWLIKAGMGIDLSATFSDLIMLAIIFSIGVLSYFVARTIINRILHVIIARSKNKWDDILLKHKAFKWLAYIIPGLLVRLLIPMAITDANWMPTLESCIDIYLAIMLISLVFSILNGIADIYETYEMSRERPIKGFLQVIKIFALLIGVILIISNILGEKAYDPFVGAWHLDRRIDVCFQRPDFGICWGHTAFCQQHGPNR